MDNCSYVHVKVCDNEACHEFLNEMYVVAFQQIMKVVNNVEDVIPVIVKFANEERNVTKIFRIDAEGKVTFLELTMKNGYLELSKKK